MQRTTEGTETQQYLTFELAGEQYAVGILRVKEIIEFTTLTTVPKTPAWVRGVINLRGQVVPVIDLAVKFGLPPTTVQKTTCIVILEVLLAGETTVMGVVADAVSQVIDLPAHEVEAPPAFGTQVEVDYLLGMGKLGNKFALILDIDRVLASDGLLALVTAPVAPTLEAAASHEC